MISKTVVKALEKFLPAENISIKEPMKKHTTFRIGGPAKYYVMPQNREQVKDIIECCKESDMPYCTYSSLLHFFLYPL